MPILFNNPESKLSPQLLTAMGAGLLTGNTWNEQIANAGLGASNAISTQQQQQQLAAAKNQTVQMLQAGAPDLASAVAAGAMTPNEAMGAYMKQKAEATTAAKPQFQKFDDGSYGFVNPSNQSINIIGTAKKPTTPQFIKLEDGSYGWANPSDQSVNMIGKTEPKQDPTSIQRDAIAAGFEPGTPEYKQFIAEHYRKTGTEITTNPDGTVTYTQGVDKRGPKLTVDEGKSAGFLVRAQNAEKVIASLEKEGTSAFNATAGKVPVVGNYMLSGEAQKYNQAQRDFVNAVLRQESGAVISDEEFSNAQQQYFPQPGDGPDVIEQKRQNREAAIEGFKLRAGPAVETTPNAANGTVVDWKDFFFKAQ